MAKKRYIIKADFLAFPHQNIYKGNEIELESSNPGTKILLEQGAIEEIKASKKEDEK